MDAVAWWGLGLLGLSLLVLVVSALREAGRDVDRLANLDEPWVTGSGLDTPPLDPSWRAPDTPPTHWG